jgi:acyl-coenzyme A thioesterase PaaI-like protein
MADSSSLALPAPAAAAESRSPPAALQRHLAALLADGFVPIVPNVGRPNFTTTLDGEMRCYFSAAQQRLVTLVYFGDLVQGPPGIVHGGALFTIVDMSLAICVSRVCQRLGFTANVAINYRSSARLRDWVVVDVAIERVEKEKKVFMTFTAKRLEFLAVAGAAESGRGTEGGVAKKVDEGGNPGSGAGGAEAVSVASRAAAAAATKETTIVDGTSLFILDLTNPAGL